ncbi:hypothetical protein [Streptomyces sp. NPDC002537]
MSTRPPLVGAVAATRSLASLALLAGSISSLPALFGSAERFGSSGIAILAALIFGLPFAWFAGPRRAWYRTRLDEAVPMPYGSPVIARGKTFERAFRHLTPPVVIALTLGLFIAYNTGIPAGLAVAGVGGGMLHQARWLAREERKLGTWILSPLVPFRVAADDPALSIYRRMPFYTFPVQPASDSGS